MGLVASSGRDNDDLVDKLIESNTISTHRVEKALRLVDRARFFPEDSRDIAYKDLAWKSDSGSPGRIHISAPCIYANVLECLNLQEGLSFLNIGSGTGYLSTVAGYLLGSSGLNHGIEIHSNIVQYAQNLVRETLHCPETQCFDWAVPEFTCGNGLFLSPAHFGKYDRVYCGASVPASYRRILWELLKIDGILVMPYNDQLQQVYRKATDVFIVKIITSVSFTDFVLPTQEEKSKALYSTAPSFMCPPRLQFLCASFIRKLIRSAVSATHKIHIRDIASMYPEQLHNHTLFEYRDGEEMNEEVRVGHLRPFRHLVVAFVETERDFSGLDNGRRENDNGDVVIGGRRFPVQHIRRIELFQEHIREHFANIARRQQIRPIMASPGIDGEDENERGISQVDVSYMNNSSNSSELSSRAIWNGGHDNGTSQDDTETIRDNVSLNCRFTKRTFDHEVTEYTIVRNEKLTLKRNVFSFEQMEHGNWNGLGPIKIERLVETTTEDLLACCRASMKRENAMRSTAAIGESGFLRIQQNGSMIANQSLMQNRDIRIANFSSSVPHHDAHQPPRGENGIEGDMEEGSDSSTTGTGEGESSGIDDDSTLSTLTSSSFEESEDDVDDMDNNGNDQGGSESSYRHRRRFYRAVRNAARKVSAAVNMEQPGMDNRMLDSNEEDSDSSDDNEHGNEDEDDDDEDEDDDDGDGENHGGACSRPNCDTVIKELQGEKQKKQERERLEERERQLKDIKKFAFLFERRVMRLPLNNTLKHYIKYLC